jgi:hypothetical protein
VKNPIGLNPVEKAQDILNFPGQVDSGSLKGIIRELLVHIALLGNTHKLEDDWLPCACGNARKDCPSCQRRSDELRRS